MDGTIKVNYEKVYERVAELTGHLENDVLPSVNSQYNEIQNLLEQVDGATNTELKITAQTNQEKVHVFAQTLLKMLRFIENSSKALQEKEQNLASQFEVK